MEKITAVALSGHSQRRDRIASVLEQASVGVLINTPCAVKVVEVARIKRPEIAVLDTPAFDIEGIHLIRQMREEDRGLKIIVLTEQNPFHFSARYRRAGASVLLRACGDMRGVAFILRAIRSGYGYFDFIHSPIKTRERSFDSDAGLIATLTDRELMVFQRLAAGLTNQKIAEEMKIGSRSISVYKTNIFEKIQLQSMGQLSALAVRNKLI